MESGKHPARLGVLMKGKMILFFLAAAMVLCACQADGEPQDINADASTLEQTEQKEPLSFDKF